MTYPLYLLTTHLLVPAVFIRLLLKSRRSPQYRRRWPERLGFYPTPPPSKPIWIHTVSVGEFNAAKPLIKRLKEKYPDIPLLITTTTPTGSAEVKAYPVDLYHVYLPYDLPIAVNKFLRCWQPRLCIIFETEIWPVLFRKSAAAGIPIIMANARLSEKSARGYRHIKSLVADTLQRTTTIAAATKEDSARLVALGANTETIAVMGNIKFDYQPPPSIKESAAHLRQQILGGTRPIWIAASTHEGEEEQILAAHAELLKQLPDALLILTPRHPERFDEVARLCDPAFNVIRRSTGQKCGSGTNLYLADTMGDLPLLYAAADAAFVGGSLAPIGGHNLIEPAAAGRAPVFGPHMHNFNEISQLLLAANGATQIANSHELAQQIKQLLLDSDRTAERGEKALNLVAQHRGATQLLIDIIDRQLDH